MDDESEMERNMPAVKTSIPESFGSGGGRGKCKSKQQRKQQLRSTKTWKGEWQEMRLSQFMKGPEAMLRILVFSLRTINSILSKGITQSHLYV